MVYKPREVTVTTTVEMHVSPDPNRDVVVITNLAGATIYWGVDPELLTTNGAPIFNNGRAEFSKQNGRDPRIARYLVIAAGSGDVRIDEESVGEDLQLNTLRQIRNTLEQMTGAMLGRK